MDATPKLALDRAQYPNQREFQLAGSTDAIAPVVDQITAFIADASPAHGAEFEVALALQEALANAVVHGCKGDASKTVLVWVGCGTAGVIVIVRDPGPGFNPAGIADPLSDDGLERDHGRGVHMMRQLMDDVHYERNGTELHMRKKFAGGC